MKKLSVKFILMSAVISMVTACGYRERHTSGTFTMDAAIADLNTLNGFSDAQVSTTANQILNQNGGTFFYATAPTEEMGNISEVFNFDISAFATQSLSFSQLTRFTAFFVFSEDNTQANFLMAGNFGAPSSFDEYGNPVFSSGYDVATVCTVGVPADFTDDVFTMGITCPTGNFYLQSFDVQDGQLADVVQIEIYNETDDYPVGVINLQAPLNLN